MRRLREPICAHGLFTRAAWAWEWRSRVRHVHRQGPNALLLPFSVTDRMGIVASERHRAMTKLSQALAFALTLATGSQYAAARQPREGKPTDEQMSNTYLLEAHARCKQKAYTDCATLADIALRHDPANIHARDLKAFAESQGGEARQKLGRTSPGFQEHMHRISLGGILTHNRKRFPGYLGVLSYRWAFGKEWVLGMGASAVFGMLAPRLDRSVPLASSGGAYVTMSGSRDFAIGSVSAIGLTGQLSGGVVVLDRDVSGLGLLRVGVEFSHGRISCSANYGGLVYGVDLPPAERTGEDDKLTFGHGFGFFEIGIAI